MVALETYEGATTLARTRSSQKVRDNGLPSQLVSELFCHSPGATTGNLLGGNGT